MSVQVNQNTLDFIEDSPFHIGEQEIQQQLGVREKIEDIGRKFIRDYIPEQHYAFYNAQPFMICATLDDTGQPWASILVGRPGFVTAPSAKQLDIDFKPIYGDPIIKNLKEGDYIGFLGIEFHTRRRNRVNGKVVKHTPEMISIKVDQSFGNCPKYIQAREWQLADDFDTLGEKGREDAEDSGGGGCSWACVALVR